MSAPKGAKRWLAKEMLTAAEYAEMRDAHPTQRMLYVATWMSVHLSQDDRDEFNARIYRPKNPEPTP